MKKYKLGSFKPLLFGLSIILLSSCERDLSEDAEFASFPTTSVVYDDNPVGLTEQFFRSFDPNLGANTDGFGTTDEDSFLGTSSIRIEVPGASDPAGNFIGGIFEDAGLGRNLTQYDALTFYAKGSTSGAVGLFGFGNDFDENKFFVARQDIVLSPTWTKYVIPIPDPSKLIQEKGLFIFSAGGVDIIDNIPNGNEIGWTFWMDEIKFESLGTVAQPQPFILDGVDATIDGFVGSTLTIGSLSQTWSTADGNVTIIPAPSYYTFTSSNTDVAIVNELGEVSINNAGTAVITASIGGVAAQGSLTINVAGDFESAPTPTRDPSTVLSIFSNAYTAGINNFTPAAFNDNNVQIQELIFNADNLISYENLGFVGLGWDGTIDVSGFTGLHVDVQQFSAGSPRFTVELNDVGPDGAAGGGDDTQGGSTVTSQVIEGQWTGIDIPLSAFTEATGGGGAGSPNLTNIANVTFVSDGGSFYIDNVYFY